MEENPESKRQLINALTSQLKQLVAQSEWPSLDQDPAPAESVLMLIVRPTISADGKLEGVRCEPVLQPSPSEPDELPPAIFALPNSYSRKAAALVLGAVVDMVYENWAETWRMAGSRVHEDAE